MQFNVGEIVKVYSTFDFSEVAAVIVEVKGKNLRVKYLDRMDEAALWYMDDEVIEEETG
jgi:hypothetical protein